LIEAAGMGRGVRLACETCGYWADLFDQAITGDAEPSEKNDGRLTSHLCPQCVEPVELPVGAEAICARCGAGLLDFATAAEELAAAARTRAAFDLRSEVAGREQVERLFAYLGAWRGQEPASAVLVDALRGQAAEGAEAASVWLPLANTTALAGLDGALTTATTADACASLLQARLAEADRAIGTLEHLMDEEADLPGVPCPRCGTGHLLHWPIWV
jgi:hypothetical protein